MNDIRSGVLIPFLQAVVTGFFSGMLIIGVLVLAGAFQLAVLAVLAGGVMLFCWLRLLGNWLAVYSPIRVVEHQPAGERAPFVTIEIKQDNRRLQFIELPASEEQLVRLAEGLLRGTPLSESAWCGAGRVFTKSEFHQLRDEMLKRQLVAWKNEQFPAQGLVLTVAGRHVFQHLINTPTLPAGDGGTW